MGQAWALSSRTLGANSLNSRTILFFRDLFQPRAPVSPVHVGCRFPHKVRVETRLQTSQFNKKEGRLFRKVYEYPEDFIDKSLTEKEDLLLRTRLALRAIGENNQSIIVFSFYPDVIAIKEVGDPLQLSEFFGPY